MPDLLPVPPPLRLELPEEWDAIEQEPDLDLLVRSRRTTDLNGMPCSAWEYMYALEGVHRAPLSQPQRDYMATMLRHIAWLVQENPVRHLSGEERVKHIGRKYRQEIRATMDALANVAFYLVEHHGWQITASSLGLKETEVRHMLKSRGKKPVLPSTGQQTVEELLETRVVREVVGAGRNAT